MSFRKIDYTVSIGGIFPSNIQNGGIQGDHRVTVLEFNIGADIVGAVKTVLDQNPERRRWCCRFDSYDGAGAVIACDPIAMNYPEDISSVTVPYLLEERLTRYGGNIQIYLVITLIEAVTGDGANIEETEAELYSFPALLRLTQKPDARQGEGESYESMTTLAERAKSAEAVASGAAEAAENSAEQAVAAEQYLKSAIVDGGIEFVFKGGNASSKRSVALTVDGELNAASENPVKNKVLAEKSKETDEALTELGEDIEKHKTEFEKSLEALKTELLIQAKLDAHPVGCLYWSEKATDPSELFGGTWVRIKDTFILAAGDTYAPGKTGGEATHKLTVEEMPEHKHDKILMGAGGNYQITYLNVGDLGSGQSAGVGINGSQPIYTSTAGGSQPHNNMPPYIAMYCWKRTA